LLNLCELIRGVSYQRGEAETAPADGPIPLIRANNINEELIFENLQYVPKKRVSDNQMLNVGDVVLAMSSGSKSVVGKAANLKKPWKGTFGAFCGVLRPTQLID
jgi:type I restriction enzyme S subunit